jgi:hypothetical protein
MSEVGPIDEYRDLFENAPYGYRNLSRRVRAFMKWIEDALAPHLE